MKKVLTIATAIIMVMSMMMLAGCGNNIEDSAEKPEVTVLAAASLTDALDEIIAEYEKDAECTITPSYAGSGDLVQQIEGGAPCDIFISASVSNMDQLEEGNYIDTETRTDILRMQLELSPSANLKQFLPASMRPRYSKTWASQIS